MPVSNPINTADGESEAIQRAQQGSDEAFEFLYRLHKRHVFSLCVRMTGDAVLAEDLAQEAFLQIFRKIATFRGDSAFGTWLYRLTVNVVLMHLRRKGLPLVSIDQLTSPSHEDGSRRELGSRDQALVGCIDRIRMERAMEQLPAQNRRSFILHEMGGYRHSEIAAMTGCSIGNSKSQLHRARRSLRELLDGPQAVPPGGAGGVP